MLTMKSNIFSSITTFSLEVTLFSSLVELWGFCQGAEVMSSRWENEVVLWSGDTPSVRLSDLNICIHKQILSRAITTKTHTDTHTWADKQVNKPWVFSKHQPHVSFVRSTQSDSQYLSLHRFVFTPFKYSCSHSNCKYLRFGLLGPPYPSGCSKPRCAAPTRFKRRLWSRRHPQSDRKQKTRLTSNHVIRLQEDAHTENEVDGRCEETQVASMCRSISAGFTSFSSFVSAHKPNCSNNKCSSSPSCFSSRYPRFLSRFQKLH